MPIELWSRKEGLRSPPVELSHAEEDSRRFPATFRVRVSYWLVRALARLEHGNGYGDVFNGTDYTFRKLYIDLCEAYGRVSLVSESVTTSPGVQIKTHLSCCPDTEVMDLIDAVFQESTFFIEQAGGADPIEEPERLAEEINRVFAEEGVGYRRVEGRLVRLDDEVTHHEAIVPALRALATGRYGHASAEFSDAVADFSRGKWRATLTHANAAFESVLKVLTGQKNGNAGDLIKAAKKQGLIPTYLGASVDNLVALVHGLPAARGQQSSAHGLGHASGEADEHLARLVLTMAAAFIVFLAAERD
jgi:hypothetical protein